MVVNHRRYRRVRTHRGVSGSDRQRPTPTRGGMTARPRVPLGPAVRDRCPPRSARWAGIGSECRFDGKDHAPLRAPLCADGFVRGANRARPREFRTYEIGMHGARRFVVTPDQQSRPLSRSAIRGNVGRGAAPAATGLGRLRRHARPRPGSPCSTGGHRRVPPARH